MRAGLAAGVVLLVAGPAHWAAAAGAAARGAAGAAARRAAGAAGSGGGARAGGAGGRCPWVHPSPGQTAAWLAGEVVGRMTLGEQVQVISLGRSGAYENTTTAVPSLCIPALTLQDGPAGLAYGDVGVTQFPAPIAVAATFQPGLAAAEGRAVGEQARAQGVDGVQGPYLNLARVPQGGRVFEGYGEDPMLAGAMGVASVTGLQSAGVLSDVKDLGVYTQETNRNFLDQVVSPAALQELYLAPFRAVVSGGKVASVMCGFGRINGVATCEDAPLLAEMRGWGFGGFVRDDVNGAPDGAAALAAGLDLFKPSPFLGGAGLALAGAHRGEIAAAARQVLTEMFRFGLVQGPPTGRTSSPVQTAAEEQAGVAVAEQGAVLLKDAGAVLPLSPATGSVAVIGVAAGVAPITAGGGSSHVVAPSVVTPLQAIRERFRAARIVYTPGEPAGAPSGEIVPPEVVPALPALPAAHHPVYYTSRPPSGVWRTWTGLLRAPVSGRYVVSVTSHGDTEVTLGGVAVLHDPGAHGPVVDEIAHSFVAGQPVRLALHWLGYNGNVPEVAWQDATPMLEAAVRAASSAEVAVVVAGAVRTEGADATSLGLPGVQDDLIAAVARANPRTVVVLDTGGAVLMPWQGTVGAIVEDWYPGQGDGTALAAVLSGAVDPSGRLPVTFPASAAATSVPGATSFPGVGGTVDLSAAGDGGLDVGYRYYQAHHVPVLFPFGYGLSYTTFGLGPTTVTPSPRTGGEVVRVDVVDTGRRAGRDVVEVYVHDPAAAHQPPLALEGFASVALAPGEHRLVTVQLPPGAFATWQGGRFVTVPGRYLVEVGSSSADLTRSVAVTLP